MFRGYDPAAVDAHIEMLATKQQLLLDDVENLRDKLKERGSEAAALRQEVAVLTDTSPSPHAMQQRMAKMLRRAVDPRFLIDVEIDDALDLACNALEIGDALIFHRVSRKLRAQLNEIGYRVFCTELDAFVRAGGSAKSLMLRLDDGPVAVQVAS